MTCWNSKLETVKTIRTPRKINAILLNIKLSWPKLVTVCGYILAINWQNFTEIYLAQVKILQKVLGGYFFDSHCTYYINVTIIIIIQNISVQHDVTVIESNSHACRTSESSFMTITITMRSLFSDTVIFSKNFHLRLAIADSADKQLNISRHASTVSWNLVLKFFSALSVTESKDLIVTCTEGMPSHRSII